MRVYELVWGVSISIHALLAESDCGRRVGLPVAGHFYPRSPCGERLWATCGPAGGRTFLSTLSLRRATGDNKKIKVVRIFLSTLSLRRATVRGQHPSWGECLFLSTLSLRRATKHIVGTSQVFQNFYPRSPCGERRRHRSNDRSPVHFYPRSPCGERLMR